MSFKLEMDNLCRGCLSTDRNILPLKKNASLFFVLLADQYIPKESSYFNMYLCWECLALLRSVAKFQKQVQRAKDIFLKEWDSEIFTAKQMKSLSRLTSHTINDFDYTIEHTETKLTTDIKIEELQTEATIKEESCDSLDHDHDLDHDNDHELSDAPATDVKMAADGGKVKKKNRRSKKASVEVTRIIYDEAAAEHYTSRVDLSPKDLEGLKRNKKGIINMSYRANVLVKNFLFKRKMDLKSGNTTLTCGECAQTFGDRSSLIEHWEGHTLALRRCRLCAHAARGGGDAARHLRQQHGKQYACACGARFRAARDFFQHHRGLHARYDCDHCQRRFKSRATIEKHMTLFHLPSKCKLCQRTYRSRRMLVNHFYIHHPELRAQAERPYCVECDLSFENHFLYKRHLRSAVAHNPKRDVKVPCPECGKIFSRKTYMTNHYNLVHVRRSKHYCELCDKYFINGYAIRTHKKFVHEKREKPRDKICEICGRGFFTNRVLINHKRTHTGERPYMCTYCPAAFAQRTAMKTHERTQHRNYINS